MGSKRRLYLGPYFEVRSPKKIERIDRCKKPAECPSPDSGARSSQADSFCSVCGIKLKGRVSRRERRPDFTEMLDGHRLLQLNEDGQSPLEIEFARSDEDFFRDCLVPNLADEVFDRGAFWLHNCAQDLTEVSHEDEILWMLEQYKEELLELVERFGQGNVRTRWGFLSYWD